MRPNSHHPISSALVLGLVLGCCGPQNLPPAADRIFVNGKIWTGDETHPTAEALAVTGETVLALGSTEHVGALASDHTDVVDLDGRLVVPGFQDSHMHLLYRSADALVLDDAESVDEIQGLLADFAAAQPDLPWITGMGWGYAAFPNNAPHKRDLDDVVADRPVYLTSRDGHMGIGNSMAMDLAGITAATPDPPNGRIVRDDAGAPTGELQESAQGLVRSLLPPQTPEQRYEALLGAMDRAAAAGLTAVHVAGTPEDDIPLYERALAEGTLQLRVLLAARIQRPEGETLPDLTELLALRERLTGPLVELSSVKGSLDGTIDARTAAMFEPYVGGGTGLPFWDPDELNRTVAHYDRAGFQVLLHAIGDRAIHMALNAFEHAEESNGASGRRHRVEHAEMPLLSDIARFRDLGVIASTQPMFANPDATVLQNFAVLLGPERARHADSFSLFDEAGVVQIFGSDYPVFTYDVLRGIEVAVTRMTESGQPTGGWYPSGRISVEAAVRHYTVDGAFGALQEDVRGTLAPGMLADFVVLSRDIFEISPTEISETEVLLTVMGGRDTYRSAGFRR